jgi:hypothetical protein
MMTMAVMKTMNNQSKIQTYKNLKAEVTRTQRHYQPYSMKLRREFSLHRVVLPAQRRPTLKRINQGVAVKTLPNGKTVLSTVTDVILEISYVFTDAISVYAGTPTISVVPASMQVIGVPTASTNST